MLGPLSVLNNSIIPDLQLDEIMGMPYLYFQQLRLEILHTVMKKQINHNFVKGFDISYIFKILIFLFILYFFIISQISL